MQLRLKLALTSDNGATTHAGCVFVGRNLDFLTPDINGVPGLMAEHFYVVFCDRFLRCRVGKNQTSGRR